MPPVPCSSLPSSLCLRGNRRGLSAAAKNMQQKCRGGSLGARVGVYKRKNGQITTLILLSYSREMFSTQAERVV